jgi:hypothetical protein
MDENDDGDASRIGFSGKIGGLGGRMKLNRLLAFSLFIVFTFWLPAPIPASAQEAGPAKPAGPKALCPPGVYLVEAQDCLPLGPSAYLTRMARQGLTFPIKPFNATHRDPQLAWVPYQYAIMKEKSASVYATLDDAAAKSAPVGVIGAGELKYVSYIQTVERKGELYFQLRSGGWIAATDGISSRVSLPGSFQGALEFKETPQQTFGWVLPLTTFVETKRTPGYTPEDYTGHQLAQYELVQVYASEKVGDMEWYMVGPDEWVEGRMIARVIPNPTPPEGVTNGRWIEVNLFEQTLSVYDQNKMVFATLIASGLEPFYTRPGLFQIYKRLETTPMSGAFEADRSDFYYLEDVPFTLYYDKARALHGAYWRHRLGYPQSHGCVNMSIGDAHWLYNWSKEGDWVYVWDPSGETPTDPAFYKDGGA